MSYLRDPENKIGAFWVGYLLKTTIPISLEIRNSCGYGRINHKQFTWQTCETDRWLLSSHVPLSKPLLKRQRHVRRRQVRAFYSTWRRSQRKTNLDRSKRHCNFHTTNIPTGRGVETESARVSQRQLRWCRMRASCTSTRNTTYCSGIRYMI